ncbi:MAG: RDD family protein [Solirubrobacteraceae bacterium]|nr:RDD family protein [Solirubrobacteraceae bacterium]
MPFIDPNADFREAQAAAAIPVGRPGVVIDGRLHPYAPIGWRITATVMDLVAYRLGLVLVLMLCAWVITLTSLGGGGGDGISVPALSICVVYIVASFGPLTYRGGGQSLGKRMIGIRVVNEDGSPAPLRTVLLRETPWRALPLILIPIGLVPTIFDLVLAGIGIVFALLATANPRTQTFYDRLAHTVVVHEDPVRLEP